MAARAILAMRRGTPTATRATTAVGCEHCGAPPWEPCTAIGTGRPLATVHPSRALAADRRNEQLRDDLEDLGEHP